MPITVLTGDDKGEETVVLTSVQPEATASEESTVVYTSKDEGVAYSPFADIPALKKAAAAEVKPQVQNQIATKTNTTSEEVATETKTMTNPFGGSAFNFAIGNSVNESVDKFVKNMEDWLKAYSASLPTPIKFELIQSPELFCPVIVTTTIKANVVYAHVLLVERFGKEAPTQTTRNGINIQYATTHAYNDRMRQIVKQRLNARNNAEQDVVFLGHAVIYDTVDLESVYNATVYACRSALAVYSKAHGAGSVNLMKLVEAGRVLRSTINIAPGTTDTDLVGMPVATDFTVSVSSTEPQQRANENQQIDMNGDVNTQKLLRANGIVDVIPNIPTLKAVNGFTNVQTFGKPGLFITNIEGASGDTTFEDTKAVLLSLAAMVPFCIDNKYVNVFDRQVRNGAKTSLGVMGLYHNPIPGNAPEGMIHTAESHDQASKKLASPRDVARDFLEDGMPLLGFDIIQGSPLAWAMRDFVLLISSSDAAEKQNAKARILKHIDDQGNGKFSETYKGDIIHHLATLHHGTFTNTNGITCHLSSVDNLAKMGACNGDVNTLAGIINNGLELCRSIEGLHNNWEFLKPLVNPVLKGFIQRVYFDPAFVVAYVDYLRSCGVHIQDEGLTRVSDSRLSGGIDSKRFQTGLAGFDRNVNSVQGNNIRTNFLY